MHSQVLTALRGIVVDLCLLLDYYSCVVSKAELSESMGPVSVRKADQTSAHTHANTKTRLPGGIKKRRFFYSLFIQVVLRARGEAKTESDGWKTGEG